MRINYKQMIDVIINLPCSPNDLVLDSFSCQNHIYEIYEMFV